MRRIVVASVCAWGISLALFVVPFLFTLPATARTCLFGTVLLASLFVSIAVIARVFRIRFLRSFLAWLPTPLPSIAMMLFAGFVVRPFIYEAFVISSNSMAPTFLGEHLQSRCPKCGEISFCSPGSARRLLNMMICGNFHINQVLDVDSKEFPADKVLVAKFVTPQRWDLVVYQFPANPASVFVSRLIGMPGETIHLDDGDVFINGRKLSPPDSLREIKYEMEMDMWGSKDRPATLGQDEYFVIGDFSTNSRDSRVWSEGAPGHNQFAVPASHIQGVVTHIYWPVQRCRILR